MLGPSVMFTSLPMGLIYSGRSVRRAPDRGFAWAGFVIALASCAFMVIAAVIELVG
ncbi:MAG TPA: hypothetical protein VFS19_07350 [Planctomycetota bacterium]|nr:hypothetical protein [Planctomycetota bacterium]